MGPLRSVAQLHSDDGLLVAPCAKVPNPPIEHEPVADQGTSLISSSVPGFLLLAFWKNGRSFLDLSVFALAESAVYTCDNV